jgi:hypothetical protein
MKSFLATALFLLVASAVGIALEWQKYTPGATGVSLDLPAKPEKMEIQLSEQARTQVRNAEHFAATTPEMMVIVSRVDYRSTDPNLSGAANGAIQSLQGTPGIEVTKMEKKQFQLGALPAFYIYVEYSAEGGSMVHQQIVAAKGKTLWQVVVTYVGANPKLVQDAKRILDSIAIKG